MQLFCCWQEKSHKCFFSLKRNGNLILRVFSSRFKRKKSLEAFRNWVKLINFSTCAQNCILFWTFDSILSTWNHVMYLFAIWDVKYNKFCLLTNWAKCLSTYQYNCNLSAFAFKLPRQNFWKNLELNNIVQNKFEWR